MPGRDNYKSVHQIRTELETLESRVKTFCGGYHPVSMVTFNELLQLFKEYINTKEMGH